MKITKVSQSWGMGGPGGGGGDGGELIVRVEIDEDGIATVVIEKHLDAAHCSDEEHAFVRALVDGDEIGGGKTLEGQQHEKTKETNTPQKAQEASPWSGTGGGGAGGFGGGMKKKKTDKKTLDIV